MRKVEELRYKFQEKLKDGIPAPLGNFDPKDQNRLKDEKYLTRIVEHCDGNVDVALKMLWSTMIWRKKEKVNEIGDTVKMEHVKQGLFFPHGRDADGSLLFIMKWKLYNKGHSTEELKKVVIYWLERLEREESGRPLTLFFDLDGCGINNLDVELVGYMVTLLKSYYPKFVNHIIIYQMPWILTAGYRIVKGLLPAKAVDRLRVINKDRLKEFVPLNQALKCWGGDDEYTFTFVPEKSNGTKRVTFADFTNGNFNQGIVRITPEDHLTFTTDNINSELAIANAVNKYVAYKIRTTAPDKFKVRPTSGVLPPDTSQTVSIAVLPGVDVSSAMKERFMVVAAEVGDDNVTQELVDEVWQRAKKYEWILKSKLCAEDTFEALMDSLDIFEVKHSEVCRGLDLVHLFQILTFVFSIILVIFEYLILNGNRYFC